MADGKSRFKPVRKSDIPALVDTALKSSVSFYDTKLSKERQDVLDYYNGKKPAPMHAGNSKYVSMDVFDAVESLKAVLLETFSAGNRIVSFDPQTEDDVDAAKTATDYTDFVVHRENDSFHIFGEVIQDGLTARVGVVKVYWDERKEEVEEEFSDVEYASLEILAESPDVLEIRAEHDEVTGLFSGTLTREVDRSQVRIDVIPPEEFLITPQATSIHAAPIVAHRTKKTISELLKMGFDPDKVNKIGSEDSDDLSTDPEVLARHEATTPGLVGSEEIQEASRYVMVYECYMHLDMKGSGKTQLFKIIKCGDQVLDMEEVDGIPFLSFAPLPVAHAFYGTNYAAKVIPTQNARTVLMRGILDHTVISNNPRYMVVKGALTNPRELLENRFGGMVNVNRPDGLLPFPQASLNPFVFQTLQLLDEDKEEVTGVSRLSQGLNKDAISKQNSQGMVNDMVSLSQQREKVIARNFAVFVKNLYLKVYELVLGHEKAEKIIQVAGQFKRISPEEWRERRDMVVELKLGYGEQEREAQKYVMLHQMLAGDPGAAPYYQTPNRHAMHATILEKAGIKSIGKYLTPMEKVQPPQPDPIVMKNLEIEERKVAAQEVVSQASAKKVDMNAHLEQMRIEMDRMRAQMEAMARDRDLDRKEYEAASRNAIAVEELAMAQEQVAKHPDDVNAIISPNS